MHDGEQRRPRQLLDEAHVEVGFLAGAPDLGAKNVGADRTAEGTQLPQCRHRRRHIPR